MSKENSSLDEEKEESHEPFIEGSTSILSISGEANLDIDGEPYSNPKCKSASISFECSDASIT